MITHDRLDHSKQNAILLIAALLLLAGLALWFW
jgi:hypothetical protein